MNRRRLLIIAASVLLLFFVLVLLFQNRGNSGTLAITAASTVPNGSKVSVVVTAVDGSQKNLTLEPGQTKNVRLGVGRVRVDGSAKNIKAVHIANITSGKTTALTTPQGEQHAIQKLASDFDGCPMVMQSTVFSYPCSQESLAYRHVPLDSQQFTSKVALFGGRGIADVKPLQDHLLSLPVASVDGGAIVDSYPTQLLLTDMATETKAALPLPGAVTALMANEVPDIITPSDRTSAQFALVFHQANQIYLFKDITDQAPAAITPKAPVTLQSDTQITRITLYNNSLVLFYGNPNEPSEGEEAGTIADDAATKAQTQYVIEYSTSGAVTRQVALPADVDATASGVQKLPHDFYAIQQQRGIDLYHYRDKHLNFVYTIQNATSLQPTNTAAYMLIDGTIYLLQPTKDGLFRLQSVFSSAAIYASGIYADAKGLVFTGFAKRAEEQRFDAYRLLDTKQTVKPVEETVPYKDLASVITAYDYDDSQIIFTVRYSGSGGATYDELLAALKRYLREQHIDVGGRTIELAPLN